MVIFAVRGYLDDGGLGKKIFRGVLKRGCVWERY